MSEVMTQGFADPPFEAQSVFRSVLGAMAHPGRIMSVTTDKGGLAMPKAPGKLDQATFALALTLLDFETPVWLDQTLSGDQPIIDALRFHCGCPMIDDPAGANFALIGNPLDCPSLSTFHQGTAEYPDRSTTVVMQVRGFNGTQDARLTGPGIKTEARLSIDGVAPNFWQQWSANQRQFPLGADIIFTGGDRLVALPRSVIAEI